MFIERLSRERAVRVIAMARGRIVEKGPRAQLPASGGLHARLHAMLSKG